ncbi:MULTISPECIES: hypothetical protein [Methylorubrum]|nr:hypothetical protein [Methylorubrum salsuginis]
MHDFNLGQKLGPTKQVIKAFRGVLATTQQDGLGANPISLTLR